MVTNAYLYNNRPRGNAAQVLFHTEITPYYTGQRRSLNYTQNKEKRISGGGVIETFGYDTLLVNNDDSNSQNIRVAKFKKTREDGEKLHQSHARFSLADSLAATGSAPTADHYLMRFSQLHRIFPQFTSWSPSWPEDDNIEFRHTDGGAQDNFGIMALLARKVDRIIVFANVEEKGAVVINKGNATVGRDLQSLFTKIEKKRRQGFKGGYNENLVFKNDRNQASGKTPLEELEEALYAKHLNGEPLVVSGRYTTKENKIHNVDKGHEVEVVWVINGSRGEERYQSWKWLSNNQWFTRLPEETKNYIKSNERTFPLLKTFAQNGLYIIDLKTEQTNLLSQYASHSIIFNKAFFEKFFSSE